MVKHYKALGAGVAFLSDYTSLGMNVGVKCGKHMLNFETSRVESCDIFKAKSWILDDNGIEQVLKSTLITPSVLSLSEEKLEGTSK